MRKTLEKIENLLSCQKIRVEASMSELLTKEDPSFEIPLRPESLSDFIGQKNVVERLDILIQAVQKRKEALGHTLLSGPPGLGKTTLAQIIAKSLQANFITTSGPAIEKPGDLAGILTNLQAKDVLFIDEIHRLSASIEEYLYSAMEDFMIDLVIDSGPHARSVPIHLPPFTLVGATTRVGLLSSPLRTRFLNHLRLDFYDPPTLEKIIQRSAQLLKSPMHSSCCIEIAKRARGTPRIANNLVKWVRDFAEIQGGGKMDLPTIKKALQMLLIDERGLDEMDKKILGVIIDHHRGGPVGIHTIAVAIGEDPNTVAEVHEPYLIMQGFLRRTPRGREATLTAYEHLGRHYSKP